MQLEFVRTLKSIAANPSAGPISDFVVLSGPNGSGKSNLIDAIDAGAITVDDLRPGAPRVRTFRLAALTNINQPVTQGIQFNEPWSEVYNQLEVLRMESQSQGVPPGIPSQEKYVRRNATDRSLIRLDVLEKLEERTGRSVLDLTLDDLRKFMPLLSGVRDPFTQSIGEVFLSYHNRWNENRFEKYLVDVDGEGAGNPISDEEFYKHYGRPPWEELNNTLAIMGMPYTFDAPEGREKTVNYTAHLRSADHTHPVAPEDLSSGEKTLLTLTMCLFMGTHMAEAIELPKVLLLDEADASLHPAMIGNMLRVIQETFVDRYHVKVILTTHSPTTVALAPEESLYIMRRQGTPRLLRAPSRDAALRTLTVGLPTLSVKVEDRIQVLVEADQDAGCYQKLYSLPLIRERLGSPFSLQFIASAKKAQGNVDIVLHSVPLLRENGADRIFGLIDRDERTDPLEHIVFLPNRDNLESLIVDPVALGLYLLREKAPSVMGSGLACVNKAHFSLDASDVQQLTDFVMRQVVPVDDQLSITAMTYLCGATITYPTWALVTDGHTYVASCRDAFPSLKAKQEAPMLHDIIDKVYAELPNWIPTDVQWIFQELLARAVD